MADLELRQAERDGDAARHLVARLRAGDVTRAGVELAAYCDHVPARTAIGWPVRVIFPWTELAHWTRGLAPWGKETCVRAGLAAARVALPEWERDCKGHYDFMSTDYCRGHILGLLRVDCRNPDERPRRAVGAVTAWLACPCERHREACAQGLVSPRRLPGWCLSLLQLVTDHKGLNTAGFLCEVVTDSARASDDTAAREAIQRALIKRALGSPVDSRGVRV